VLRVPGLRTLAGGPDLLRAPREAWWAAAATLAVVAITIWWLTVDRRVPDFDSGNHLLDIFTVRGELLAGNLSAPFTDWNNYPPLGHLIGAVGTLIGGYNVASVVMAQNLVVLPLLAAGCYGAGTIAAGRRAGLLAALFALGTPMVVSESREIYLDLTEAAMVAVSVWAILATRRFKRIRLSVLAGFVCSLGMLSKQTFPLFIAGLLAVVILRGGWRNWRGIAAYIVGGAGLTLPWYVYHYSELAGLTSGATAGGNAGAGVNVSNGITPSRLTPANLSWYGWNLVNHQILVPLALFLVVGIAIGIWRFTRRRDRDDVVPELLGGALFGFAAETYLTLKDPRYTLPALVYLAVIATFWVPTAARRLRPWLVAMFAVVVVANVIAVSFGFGPTLTLVLPGAPMPSTDEARVLTFYSPNGWVRGGPEREGDLSGLLGGLQRMGYTQLDVDGGSANSPDFNNAGLSALALMSGLSVPGLEDLPAMGPTDAFILRRAPQPGDPPPCAVLDDGTGVYISPGNPLTFAFDETTFVCPGRRPAYYRNTTVIGAPVMPASLRTELLSVLTAMRRAGVRRIEFDPTSLQYLPFLDHVGLEDLAAQAGLYDIPRLGLALDDRSVEWVRLAVAKGGPPACARFPDGTGLYIVRGGHPGQYFCPLLSPQYSKA
jgi:hypothetical protein